MFKYGSQDIFRIQNTTLIEKYDPCLNTIEDLKNAPVRLGNQKRKRMLKHFEKVNDLMNKINFKEQIKNN